MLILKPTASELKVILEAHHKWCMGDPKGTRANLSYANLSYANMSYANLSYADLSYANLSYADLSDANLSYANLSDANLSDANLSYALNIPTDVGPRLSILPDEGDVIGFKKCAGGVIVKLLIKAGTPRSNATGRKCRAAEAKVLSISDGSKVAASKHDGGQTKYTVGRIVKCDEWNPNRWVECTGGIHFFITRAEAEAY